MKCMLLMCEHFVKRRRLFRSNTTSIQFVNQNFSSCTICLQHDITRVTHLGETTPSFMFAMIVHGFDFMTAWMIFNHIELLTWILWIQSCCSGACTFALAFTKKRRSIAAFSACASEGKRYWYPFGMACLQLSRTCRGSNWVRSFHKTANLATSLRLNYHPNCCGL